VHNDLDLAARVAVLERLASGRLPRLLQAIGCLLLATLLTMNAWILWRNLSAAAADRLSHHFWVLCREGASEDQRREALTELLRAGHREWRSARLAGLKLRRGDFDGAQLPVAEMTGCDFTQSSLIGANLKGANLRMAKLANADLSSANLAEASLFKADLTHAAVRRARLAGASLEQSSSNNADFEGSDFGEADLLLAVMTKANLRGANLSWSNLDAADLRGANLEGANLENASLFDTDFTDSNWWRAAGLPSDVIDRFRRDFQPTAKASQAFQEDYQKWLKE
jgi:uncharacterized protein YjbI with pentapeptide repeats